MKRCHFIQVASSTLATLALGQWDIVRQGDRYAQVLDQSTPRKLALLVGINHYTGDDRGLRLLNGCLTDVDLQTEVQNAIKRLSPKLQSLVAAYLVRQTLNASTSNLNVAVQIHRQDRPEFRIAKASTQSGQDSTRMRSLPLKTPFQFQIFNGETTSLYLLIALFSPSGKLAILFPNNYTLGNLNQVSQVAAKSTRLVPDPSDQDFFQLIPQVVGRGEALVVASRKPLDRAFKRLQTLASEQSTQRGPVGMGSTEEIADLLTDLSSRSGSSSYIISTTNIATLSVMFEITTS